MAAGHAPDEVDDDRAMLQRGRDAEGWPDEVLGHSIVDRFVDVARRFPDRPAVATRDGTQTYRDLDRRSTAIAAEVADAVNERVAGGPPRPIALLLHQGASVPSAILAILRTGAPFVPLDPGHPPATLRALVDHADIAAILVDPRTSGVAGRANLAVPLIDVDAPDPSSARTWEGPVIDPDAPASLYFTSGSTGAPKGVLDTHRNILHNVRRYAESLAIGPEDRLTLVHAPTFSGIVSSLFAALLDGAAVLPFDLRHEGLDRATPWLVGSRATMLHCVPAVFRGIARDDALFPDLRVVRLEGDLATWGDVDRFRRHVGRGAMLVNGLGATETGLTRQFFVAGGSTRTGIGALPVGYPVADVAVRVTDDGGEPVAAGVVGDLVVSSRYLASGYWRDDDRTRQAFRDDLDDPAIRSFRTGDVGYLDVDGRLHHLGRRDHVRKVRGQTVEPAILESALLARPDVVAAVAITRDDDPLDVRLVAYVVPATDRRPEDLDLVAMRRDLRGTVPDLLIPSAVVVLDAIPLTSTGKVDRSGLPAPDHVRPNLATPYVGPRDPLEEALVRVWEAVTGVRPVGVFDDFFDLGGDSLGATTMLLEVQRAFGPDLDPAVMTLAPSIDVLAGTIRAGPTAINGRRRIFAIHAAHDRPTLFRELARALPAGVDLVSLYPRARPDGTLAYVGVDDAAAAFASEIRATQAVGPYHVVGFCYGGLLALETARRLDAPEASTAAVTLLGVSPLEFPTLIGRDARVRYRRAEWRRRRRMLRGARDAGGAAGLARLLVRWSHTWLIRTAFQWRRSRARSDALVVAPDQRAIADAAIANHHARPFEGDLTVVLGRDEPSGYVLDPEADLGGLATGHVRLVRTDGDDHAMLRAPVADVLGALLVDLTNEGAAPV
jgi:amino acid adenylation domain-containing protein